MTLVTNEKKTTEMYNITCTAMYHHVQYNCKLYKPNKFLLLSWKYLMYLLWMNIEHINAIIIYVNNSMLWLGPMLVCYPLRGIRWCSVS